MSPDAAHPRTPVPAAPPPSHPLIARRRLPLLALGTGIGVAGVTVLPTPALAADRISLERWTDDRRWGTGSRDGVAVTGGAIVLHRPTRTATFADPHTGRSRRYDLGTWTSSWQRPGRITELIPSWNASTSPGSWVQVRVQGVTTGGVETTWYDLGRWTLGRGRDDIRRGSVPGQRDAHARVAADTLVTAERIALAGYRVQVRLWRLRGSTARVTVGSLTVMTSALPKRSSVTTSRPSGRASALDLPRYSQQAHVGHSREYGGGGEAWCSPTSLAMVLDHLRLPAPASHTSWVGAGHREPQVDEAARRLFDHGYDGCGNWAFATAYAHTRGATAFVTRLRSLREAELFVAAGIPLVASVTFRPGELSGAGYGTAGHLLVISGFTRAGDVICHDPAAGLTSQASRVRITYQRQQFENVWVPRSGGLVYVVHRPDQRLPASLGNW